MQNTNQTDNNNSQAPKEPVWKKYARRHRDKNNSNGDGKKGGRRHGGRRRYGNQGQKSDDPLSPSFSHFFSFPLTHLS